MGNPVSRWVTNVFNAGEKLGHATGIQTTLGPSRQDNSKEQTAARGQAWGALLQNRTYDEQGRIKGTQADHHVTDHTNHTRPLPKDQQAIVDVAQRLGNADKKSK